MSRALVVLLFVALSPCCVQAEETCQSAWAKRCLMIVSHQGKEGSACLTYKERVDASTRRRLFYIGLWRFQIDEEAKQYLEITVPPGARKSDGVRVFFFPTNEWEWVRMFPKLHPHPELAALKLAFASCNDAYCIATVQVAPELFANLKSNSGALVHVVDASGKAITYDVPLAGFAETLMDHPVPPIYSDPKYLCVSHRARERGR
jgi:hypothetical protein